YIFMCCLFFFFFQAEDGIRDRNVTGVQTCALPISSRAASRYSGNRTLGKSAGISAGCAAWATRPRKQAEAAKTSINRQVRLSGRSEERRVGKEGRSEGGADECNKREEGQQNTEEKK